MTSSTPDASSAASAAGEGFPLVAIVRTLVNLDAAPAELEDAAWVAGPEELAFAREPAFAGGDSWTAADPREKRPTLLF